MQSRKTLLVFEKDLLNASLDELRVHIKVSSFFSNDVYLI